MLNFDRIYTGINRVKQVSKVKVLFLIAELFAQVCIIISFIYSILTYTLGHIGKSVIYFCAVVLFLAYYSILNSVSKDEEDCRVILSSINLFRFVVVVLLLLTIALNTVL